VENVGTYHFIERCSSIVTFMPNTPARNVRGRKMKVIQLSLNKLRFTSRDCFASRMLTDL